MMNELSDQLKEEYLQLQAQYEEFDNRALTIKSWGTALLAGGVAFGSKENSIVVLIVAITAALSLWALEVIWKSFQYCLSPRINEIEQWFRDGQKGEIVPFQIYSSWLKEWNSKYRPWFKDNREKWRIDHRKSFSNYWPIIRSRFVYLPYLPIIVLSLLCAIWLALFPPSTTTPATTVKTSCSLSLVRPATSQERVAEPAIWKAS
jgi:hypothetical protein